MFSFILLFLFVLADSGGSEKLVSNSITTVNYSPTEQCFKDGQETAKRSFRLNFRQNGSGFCEFVLCYPSQLSESAVVDGLMPEKPFTIGQAQSNMSNMVRETCRQKMGEAGERWEKDWHGIWLKADWNEEFQMNMSLMVDSEKTFKIGAKEFQLLLGGGSDHGTFLLDVKLRNSTTKEFKSNEVLKGELQEGYNSKNNENDETFFMDFGGAWQFPLDFFPLNSEIKVFASQWNEKDQKCNLRTGKYDKKLAECQIDATLLHPSEDNPQFEDQEVKLPNPLTDYPHWKVGHSKAVGEIFISSKIVNKHTDVLEIYLLHGGITDEPDPAIMSQTVLYIKLRSNSITYYGIYNNTKMEEHKIGLQENFGFVLDDKLFAFNIQFEGQGEFQLRLNCKPNETINYKLAVPLSTLSIDNIYINGTMILTDITSITYKDAVKTDVPPIAMSLNLPELGTNNFLLIKFKLPNNSNSFDIRFINFNENDKMAKILLHFFGNVSKGTEQYFLLNNELEGGLNFKNTNYSLIAGQEFRWYFVVNWGIYLNGHKIYTANESTKIYDGEEKANYIQFIGDLEYKEMSVFERKSQKTTLLDYPFQLFKDIVISANSSSNLFPELTIQFLCANENKCRRSSNSSDLAFEIKILDKTLFITDGNNVQELPFNHSLWESFEIRIHAGLRNYSINGTFLNSEFPTPIHIDSVNISQGNIGVELEPVEPDELELAMPFSYLLQKPLENGSEIRIQMKMDSHGDMVIKLLHSTQYKNDELWTLVHGIDLLYITTSDIKIEILPEGINDVLPIDIGKTVELNITFLQQQFEIYVNGKVAKTHQYKFPLSWAVDMVEVNGNAGKVSDFEIYRPSDNTTIWLPPRPNKLWKVLAMEKKLAENNYLAIKCKLSENPTSFVIRFVQFNENDKKDKILLDFFATFSNEKQHFLLNHDLNGPNPILKNLEPILIAGSEFICFFDINRGIYLNGHQIYTAHDFTGIYGTNIANYIQLIGDLEYQDMDMSVVEWKSQNIALQGPFQPLKDIAVSAKGQQHVFPELAIQLLCVNPDKCLPQSDASNKETFNMKGVVFEIKISYTKVSINDGKNVKEFPFTYNANFDLRIHAGQNDYWIRNNGEILWKATHYSLPWLRQIDSAKINQDAQIELKDGHDQLDLAIPFSYRLPKTLQLGSTMKLRVNAEKGEFEINLLHRTPYHNNHTIGSIVYMIIVNAVDAQIKIMPGGQLHQLHLLKWSPIFECEIIFQNQEFQLFVDGIDGRITHKSDVSNFWAVDFVEVKGSAMKELEQFAITWPSDISNNWLKPAQNVSVKMPNSWEVFGFDEIKIKVKVKESTPTIRLLNTCWGGWDPEICDIVANIKLTEGNEPFTAYSHLDKKWIPHAEQKIEKKFKKDSILTLTIKYSSKEKLYIITSSITKGSWTVWNIAKLFPFDDIAYLTLFDLDLVEGPTITKRQKDVFVFKIDRLLKVFDAILFKGYIIEKKGKVQYDILYGASDASSKAAIKIGTIRLSLEDKTIELINNQGNKCSNNNLDIYTKDNQFIFELLIGENGKFVIRSAEQKSLLECHGFELFWAIQYIYINVNIQYISNGGFHRK